MSGIFYIIATVSVFLVLIVLLFGVFSFARGGEFNRKWSNKIMRLRVLAQFVAIVLILITVLLMQSGK